MSIFVSVVSDDASELAATLRSALDRSRSASELHFGIVNTSAGLAAQLQELELPPQQVFVLNVPQEPIPAGAARSLAASLYRGEDWVLQMEPGFRFQPGWDARLVDEAGALSSVDRHFVISERRVLKAGASFESGHPALAFETRSVDVAEPAPGFHLTQACLFAPGEFLQHFPADPWLDDAEADQALAVRLFTHGWKIYQVPGFPISRHAVERGPACAPADATQARSRERLQRLFSGEGGMGIYGLGAENSLNDYALASGIDYAKRKIASIAYSGPLQEAMPPLPSAAGRPLDDSWKGWLSENLQRGCNPEELLGILLKHQFSLASVRESMGVFFPASSPLLGESTGAARPGADYALIAQPALIRRRNPKLRRVETDKLQLYTLDDCLGHDECDALVEVINRYLRPSTVTLAGTDRNFRTSRTSDLSALQDPLVAMIDEKIARTLGIRRSYAEPNQAQRYDVGQEFKAHTDYFEPGTEEFATFGGDRGNRTWTFMVYLNEGMKGGGTRFVALDKVFEPKKGRAVIWNNLYPDGTPNPDTLHCGMPVTQGHKIIITMWFRALGNGPMFFDD